MKHTVLSLRSRMAAAALLSSLVVSAPALHAQKTHAAPARPAPARPQTTRPATTARPGTTTRSSTAARPSTVSRPGAAATRPGASPGSHTTPTAHGGEMTRTATGKPESFHAANGNSARFDARGRVHEVHAGNTTITHGPGGARHIVQEGPNHTRYVTDAHGNGYVQRPYMYGGHAYQNRTYYRNGVIHQEYYRSYYYNGVYLSGYYPGRFYGPAFYGWAYNPWVAPVYYSWGWGAAPWYGYYGPYFAPAPVYATASLWLTDYLIAASLQQAYQAGAAAAHAGEARLRPPVFQQGWNLQLASYTYPAPLFAPDAGGAVAMTPQIKQAIADEISSDLAQEKSEAAAGGSAPGVTSGLDAILADGRAHVFVASQVLTVPQTGTQDCGLTAGDVLQLSAPPAKDADQAQLQVLASKSGDCAQGSTVTLTIENLQDMHNSLMSTVDDGLGDLQKKAGSNGLPAAPAGSTTTTTAAYAAAAPPPDPNGAQQLQQVAAQGLQDDQQVTSEADGATTPPAAASDTGAPAAEAPAQSTGMTTIALGQTIAQVIASKGHPQQIVNLGAKQIYVYSDIKIYFTAGKVVDVR